MKELDRRCACFDRLGTRVFLGATKILPHPEPVEERRIVLPACGTFAWGAGSGG